MTVEVFFTWILLIVIFFVVFGELICCLFALVLLSLYFAMDGIERVVKLFMAGFERVIKFFKILKLES